MSNIDDFTARDIFSHDEDGNTLYKRDGVYYIINDIGLQQRLQKIEGYRSFLNPRSLRAMIIVPVFFLTAVVSGLLYLALGDRVESFYGLLFYLLFFGLYFYIKYLHEAKIQEVLKQCKSVNSKPQKPKKKKITTTPQQEPSSPKIRTKKIYPKIYISPSRPWIERVKSAIPDFNFFHILMFTLIASPFLFVVYLILRGMILGDT